MIVLDSEQLLAAVKRSLNAHILPNLTDQFARVQVAAILKVLDEVEDRLANGDPMDQVNAGITQDSLALAARLRSDSPAFADAIEQAVGAVPEDLDPRAHNRALIEGLWPLAADDSTPEGKALLALLIDHGARSGEQDARWMCPEALLSLI